MPFARFVKVLSILRLPFGRLQIRAGRPLDGRRGIPAGSFQDLARR